MRLMDFQQGSNMIDHIGIFEQPCGVGGESQDIQLHVEAQRYSLTCPKPSGKYDVPGQESKFWSCALYSLTVWETQGEVLCLPLHITRELEGPWCPTKEPEGLNLASSWDSICRCSEEDSAQDPHLYFLLFLPGLRKENKKYLSLLSQLSWPSG